MYNKLFVSLLFAILLLSACTNNSSSQKDALNNTGSATIKLPGTSTKAALSTKSIDYNTIEDITRYHLVLTCDGLGYSEEKDALPGETITFNKLFAGMYAISIRAFDKHDTAIFGGDKKNISVTARNTTSVTIVLEDLIADSLDPDSRPWAPKRITATITSATQVDLTWKDCSLIETGYRVYKRTASDTAFTLIAELEQDAESYSDTAYSSATDTTWYRVCAYNTHGSSNYLAAHLPEDDIARYNADTSKFDQIYWEN